MGHRGRQYHDGPPAGSRVVVAVLKPGEFALPTRRQAGLPSRIDEQLLATPVGHGSGRFAHDQVCAKFGEGVVPQ
jgi:hypothetical protein